MGKRTTVAVGITGLLKAVGIRINRVGIAVRYVGAGDELTLPFFQLSS